MTRADIDDAAAGSRGCRIGPAADVPARVTGRVTAGSERGSGTVLALAIVLVVATLLVVMVLYGAVVLATHRARTAADLAALTASTRLLDGASDAGACAEAERVARANGGRILVCRAGAGAPGTVETAVSVELPAALRRLGPAYAVARAGPRS